MFAFQLSTGIILILQHISEIVRFLFSNVAENLILKSFQRLRKFIKYLKILIASRKKTIFEVFQKRCENNK